jgi:hypothetical protein
MLAVIDESGDPGFSIGSSPYFAIAMVRFDSFEDAETVAHAVKDTKNVMGVRRELKFNSSNHRVRSEFLHAMRDQPFKLRAIVINKHTIRDSLLRNQPQQFAFYALHQLVSESGLPWIPGTILKIDRYGDRSVCNALST